jgi:hypothetical protein
MRELEMNYPVVMGNPKIVGDYGFVTAIPTTFVIDRLGEVVTAYEGFRDQATFESVIAPLLENTRVSRPVAILGNKRVPYLLLTYMPTRVQIGERVV